jgi:hypothetical protein
MGHLNLQNILFMFHHIHVTFKFREFGAAASNNDALFNETIFHEAIAVKDEWLESLI